MFSFFDMAGEDMDESGGPGRTQRERAKKPVDTEGLYKVLGVEKTATQADIKKAYRRAAMTHHPDKGGDEETFKRLTRAYEVLSDEKKRKIYDEHGEEGLENGGASEGPMDIFDLFMGGGRRRAGTGERRGEDVVFPLKVTLDELYNGATKKLRLTKNVLCSTCSGKGSKTGEKHTCRACRGRGARMIVRQIGPGMIQQMQAACDECHGEGNVVPEGDRCEECNAARTVKVQKPLEVFIRPGMRNGEKITFRGEADEAPDTTPGDVIVVLQQKEHPIFTREGPHLFFKKTISLNEALTGFEFILHHMDERALVVRSTPGHVYRPGQVMAIRNEGMPVSQRNQFERGNLYIQFDVQFPANGEIPDNTRQLIRRILPGRQEAPPVDTQLPEQHEEVQLVEVDMEAEQQRFAQQHREAYEEDDEPRHHGPQCRQA